jgi:RES domain-containing protein
MRLLWRISNHCDLQGLGGERSAGRWHTPERGKRIVYLSEHPALALIEVLANLKGNPKLLPDSYQLMKIAVRDQVAFTALERDSLPNTWRDDEKQTRSLGDSWLANGHSALLAVPSVPSPESTNYLMNPLHPDAEGVEIDWCKWIKYDQRLFHISERTE